MVLMRNATKDKLCGSKLLIALALVERYRPGILRIHGEPKPTIGAKPGQLLHLHEHIVPNSFADKMVLDIQSL